MSPFSTGGYVTYIAYVGMGVSRFWALLAVLRTLDGLFPFRGARLMPELVFGQLTLLYYVSLFHWWICCGPLICKYG